MSLYRPGFYGCSPMPEHVGLPQFSSGPSGAYRDNIFNRRVLDVITLDSQTEDVPPSMDEQLSDSGSGPRVENQPPFEAYAEDSGESQADLASADLQIRDQASTAASQPPVQSLAYTDVGEVMSQVISSFMTALSDINQSMSQDLLNTSDFQVQAAIGRKVVNSLKDEAVKSLTDGQELFAQLKQGHLKLKTCVEKVTSEACVALLETISISGSNMDPNLKLKMFAAVAGQSIHSLIGCLVRAFAYVGSCSAVLSYCDMEAIWRACLAVVAAENGDTPLPSEHTQASKAVQCQPASVIMATQETQCDLDTLSRAAFSAENWSSDEANVHDTETALVRGKSPGIETESSEIQLSTGKVAAKMGRRMTAKSTRLNAEDFERQWLAKLPENLPLAKAKLIADSDQSEPAFRKDFIMTSHEVTRMNIEQAECEIVLPTFETARATINCNQVVNPAERKREVSDTIDVVPLTVNVSRIPSLEKYPLKFAEWQRSKCLGLEIAGIIQAQSSDNSGGKSVAKKKPGRPRKTTPKQPPRKITPKQSRRVSARVAARESLQRKSSVKKIFASPSVDNRVEKRVEYVVGSNRVEKSIRVPAISSQAHERSGSPVVNSRVNKRLEYEVDTSLRDQPSDSPVNSSQVDERIASPVVSIHVDKRFGSGSSDGDEHFGFPPLSSSHVDKQFGWGHSCVGKRLGSPLGSSGAVKPLGYRVGSSGVGKQFGSSAGSGRVGKQLGLSSSRTDKQFGFPAGSSGVDNQFGSPVGSSGTDTRLRSTVGSRGVGKPLVALIGSKGVEKQFGYPEGSSGVETWHGSPVGSSGVGKRHGSPVSSIHVDKRIGSLIDSSRGNSVRRTCNSSQGPDKSLDAQSRLQVEQKMNGSNHAHKRHAEAMSGLSLLEEKLILPTIACQTARERLRTLVDAHGEKRKRKESSSSGIDQIWLADDCSAEELTEKALRGSQRRRESSQSSCSPSVQYAALSPEKQPEGEKSDLNDNSDVNKNDGESSKPEKNAEVFNLVSSSSDACEIVEMQSVAKSPQICTWKSPLSPPSSKRRRRRTPAERNRKRDSRRLLFSPGNSTEDEARSVSLPHPKRRSTTKSVPKKPAEPRPNADDVYSFNSQNEKDRVSPFPRPYQSLRQARFNVMIRPPPAQYKRKSQHSKPPPRPRSPQLASFYQYEASCSMPSASQCDVDIVQSMDLF